MNTTVILARLERAVGEQAMTLVGRDLPFWKTTGNVEAIEEWRGSKKQRNCKRGFKKAGFKKAAQL